MNVTSSGYWDVRRRARSVLNQYGMRNTESTSLVNAAFIRVMKGDTHLPEDKRGFLAYMSKVLRATLISSLEERNAQKRGGGQTPRSLDGIDVADRSTEEVILEVDEILERLAEEAPELAEIVEMKFFGGYTSAEIAEALGEKESQIETRWRRAKKRIYGDFKRDAGG